MAPKNLIALNTEEVMDEIGQFGRFQKLLDTALFILNLPVAYQILISYFVTFTPSWKCKDNTTCSRIYGLQPNHHTESGRCSLPRNEWYYTEPEHYSMVTDFALDCGKEWLVSFMSSVYFVGWAAGGLLLGIVGDKYGRKFIIFPSVLATIVLGFLTSFLKNVYLVMICRFIIGFFNPGATLQSFILVSEYVGERHRSFAGIVVYMTLPIGYILVACQSYLIQNWRFLYMICTIPYIFTLFFYTFVPESIKWLILHENTATARATLRRASVWNKKKIGNNVEVVLTKEDELLANESNDDSLVQIFKSSRLFITTNVQSVVWLATGMAYFGLSLVADDLGGTLYRDFILLSMMELPAFPAAIFLSNNCGRKVATLVPLMFGGLCSCVVACIPFGHHLKIFRTVVGIMGKFCLSVSFDAIFTWTLEMYPTSVRSTGMGILQTVSHLGSACAPWMAKGLRHVAGWLPYVALGVPAIMAALAGLYLPETKTKNEEDTTKLLKNPETKWYMKDVEGAAKKRKSIPSA